MGMMISSKRNSVSSSSSGSDNRPHTPAQNLGEKIVAFINVQSTGPIVFTCAISLRMDIEAINFQGNETHLSDFPASSFILGMKKKSV